MYRPHDQRPGDTHRPNLALNVHRGLFLIGCPAGTALWREVVLGDAIRSRQELAGGDVQVSFACGARLD